LAELCNAFDDTFWPGLRWPEFVDMPDKDSVVVVLPVVGFSDWGIGLPLDIEEVVAMEVLARASERAGVDCRHLVLPPLRFALAPVGHSFFGVSPDEAHRSLQEIVQSIQASGFRKVVLYNSSPWNEDLIDAAGRDLRIALGMQMFGINLSGLNLDLLPGRSCSRKAFQLLGAYLLNKEPGVISDPHAAAPNFNEAPIENREPCDDAVERLPEVILDEAASKMASLLVEVAGRASLPNNGAIPTKEWKSE
jgi:creatinine amidohydrolase